MFYFIQDVKPVLPVILPCFRLPVAGRSGEKSGNQRIQKVSRFIRLNFYKLNQYLLFADVIFVLNTSCIAR
jgi:hypothetical protein